ncbi:3-deoxy-D-manno-octulosonic acid transferase [Flagellimonas aequoris]|uniref:3-deoxy-D-manno-octulosonic acid transferase n=1 Tax=Flagellimonas aequoris TaxID=2306997 RepID=A0A418NB78_9FLAO|nr:glycosyltransferase N-terminal domain-containing protein [Allomuricauda aequoris]RIV73721.1 3-deoxy-D-manno-octulosonic acid transferase [Allomuricauda aequoris]TXK07405.1 3-deoxy-D-manno-octulosonic acid transferase [Allomuricauda aequoris]
MPLRFLYNILVNLAWTGLHVLALFQPKIKLFVSGRKETFSLLEGKLFPNTKTVWMHVASLGEFEQGLPILERLRSQHPNHQIVLTFFSPSGYEVKKNTPIADVVAYLPMDTMSNTTRFLDLVKPELVIFVKYEIWPNYLHQLKKRGIPTFLVSAIFSKRQVYFKFYGGFMRNSLKTFSHFFVQDENSKILLQSIGFENITVGGDTRLDRVSEILKRDNRLEFMERFKNGQFCLVAGSTWPEDEKILIDYINSVQEPIKFVIAPHEIKPAHVEKITSTLQKKVVCYSDMEDKNLKDFDVLIIDTIGILTKVYSYADFAYVGGGFATGLHNTMEPAVFGIPIIIGPQYHGFKEAEDLVARGGIVSISDQTAFNELMRLFVENPAIAKEKGTINSSYINANVGAADRILDHISQFL